MNHRKFTGAAVGVVGCADVVCQTGLSQHLRENVVPALLCRVGSGRRVCYLVAQESTDLHVYVVDNVAYVVASVHLAGGGRAPFALLRDLAERHSNVEPTAEEEEKEKDASALSLTLEALLAQYNEGDGALDASFSGFPSILVEAAQSSTESQDLVCFVNFEEADVEVCRRWWGWGGWGGGEGASAVMIIHFILSSDADNFMWFNF